jgi:hypothetical protein
MSSADPVVLFLAGGVTGILGTIVAEIAASRRQARQLEHELSLGVRELALKEVGEAVDLMFAMLDSTTDLHSKMQKAASKDRGDETSGEVEEIFGVCNTQLGDMRAHDIKLSLRFGDSGLIDCFSAVTREFQSMLDGMRRAFDERKAEETPPQLPSLIAAMERFSEQARIATGGL